MPVNEDTQILIDNGILADFTPINVNAKGDVLPAKNDLIALIDADTIAFSAASVTEISMDLLPRTFYSDSEWAEITSDPDFDEANGIIYNMDQEQALRHCDSKIEEILERTGCQEFELHFSGGRDNFRYTVMPTYKHNRLGMHTPAGLRELKEALIEKYGGYMATKYEADDIVVCKYHQWPDKYLVCAVDKDVLGSVPKAFNYYFKAATTKNGKSYAEIPMKFVENSENSVLRHPYFQCLMGDSNDGIQGIFGCGKVCANKTLDSAPQTPEGLWKAVKDAYETAGMSEFDAIQAMQLVDMNQLVYKDEAWSLKLWLPPREEDEDSTD